METSCKNLVQENQDVVKELIVDEDEDVGTSNAPTTLHILDLPDSILFQILIYLPFSSVGAIAQVCTTFCRISSDELLWRHVFLQHYKLPASTVMPGKAKSWRQEFKRLYYHTPAVLSEERKEHKDEVLHVSFSHDGTMFATCSKDGYFKVWECTHPVRLLFKMDMKSTFSWKFTQFSQFNETDTCLLVSGVYFGRLSTSGEIAVFNLQDDFKMQCRVTNKPYDVFGAWYDNDHLLSGTLYWTGDFNSVSAVWLSKASQEVESEVESVSMVLYRFENVNSSSIRLLHVAEVDRDSDTTEGTMDKEELEADGSAQTKPHGSSLGFGDEGKTAVDIDVTKNRLGIEDKEVVEVNESCILDRLLHKYIAEDEFDLENEDKTDNDGEGDDFNIEVDASTLSDPLTEPQRCLDINHDKGDEISKLSSKEVAFDRNEETIMGHTDEKNDSANIVKEMFMKMQTDVPSGFHEGAVSLETLSSSVPEASYTDMELDMSYVNTLCTLPNDTTGESLKNTELSGGYKSTRKYPSALGDSDFSISLCPEMLGNKTSDMSSLIPSVESSCVSTVDESSDCLSAPFGDPLCCPSKHSNQSSAEEYESPNSLSSECVLSRSSDLQLAEFLAEGRDMNMRYVVGCKNADENIFRNDLSDIANETFAECLPENAMEVMTGAVNLITDVQAGALRVFPNGADATVGKCSLETQGELVKSNIHETNNGFDRASKNLHVTLGDSFDRDTKDVPQHLEHGSSSRDASLQLDLGSSIKDGSQHLEHDSSSIVVSQQVMPGSTIRFDSQQVMLGSTIRSDSQQVTLDPLSPPNVPSICGNNLVMLIPGASHVYGSKNCNSSTSNSSSSNNVGCVIDNTFTANHDTVNIDMLVKDSRTSHNLKSSIATQTEIANSRASSFHSLSNMSQSSSISRDFKCSTPREKLLIYTWGSETYIPHKVGIKRMKWTDFTKGEVTARRSSMLLPDVMENLHNMAGNRRDKPDVTIEMHGHIVGLSLSPDHRYLYVNCRPWPKNYIISDPQESPPLAQEVEISTIDLTTFNFVGPVLRSHKAYTHSDECFFLNLDVSDDYVASGAEDRQGYLWDRHYGIPLYRFPHRNVVNCVAINPQDPEILVTVSDDYTFKVWMSRSRASELTGSNDTNKKLAA